MLKTFIEILEKTDSLKKDSLKKNSPKKAGETDNSKFKLGTSSLMTKTPMKWDVSSGLAAMEVIEKHC